MMAEAEEKRNAAAAKAEDRANAQAAKAMMASAQKEQAEKAEKLRDEMLARKLENELRKEEEERQAKAKPKPGTQCIMRNVPKVTPLKSLEKMFETSGGPVKRVTMVKQLPKDGEEDEMDDVEGYDPHLASGLCKVQVTFQEPWMARRALEALAPKLEWNPVEVESGAVEPALAVPKKRRKRRGGARGSGAKSVPLKLPSVTSSFASSGENESSFRPKTPVNTMESLLDIADDVHGSYCSSGKIVDLGSTNRVLHHKIAPVQYSTWRRWTKGQGGSIAHRMEMNHRAKSIVRGEASKGLMEPGHESIAVLRKAWHTVDEDFSGYLDRAEVGKLIELLLGHPITVHGVRRALKKMDQDDSGFVSFGEFESWWRERCARLFCNTRGLFWPLCCDVSSSVAVCKLCRSSLGICSWRGARELYDPALGQRK